MARERIGEYRVVRRLGIDEFTETFLVEPPARLAAADEVATGAAADGRRGGPYRAETRGSALRTHQLLRRLRSDLDQDELRGSLMVAGLLANQLRHENILAVERIEVLPEHAFIVTEQVVGWTLDALAPRADDPLPLAAVVQLVRAICRALDHAHRRLGDDGEPLDLVHHAINPRHVLVADDGRVLVTDFGLAPVRARLPRRPLEVADLGYLAPEQIQERSVDQRADLFSTAVILHELLAGRRLFGRPTAMETLNAVLKRRVPPPSRYRADLPRRIETITLRALERDRRRRFSTAHRLASALEQAAPELTGEAIDLAQLARDRAGPPPDARGGPADAEQQGTDEQR